jgi:hypothetical protein
MSDQKAKKPPLPRWAWLFAAACLAIPVLAIGGAIPTAIGVGGAFYCMAVVRATGRPTRHKLVHCAAVTAACWVLFLAGAGGVALIQTRFPGLMQTKHTRPMSGTQNADPSSMGQQTPGLQETVLTDEAQRREIYAKAVRMRKHLELAIARKSDRRDRGLDTKISDRQIEHVREMHEKRLEFMTRFYKITREQMNEIIAEGDRARWPTE